MLGLVNRKIRSASSAATGRRIDRRTAAHLALTAAGTVLGVLALLPGSQPRLVWNYTQSVPPGLYRIEHNEPSRGDILAVDPSGELATLLDVHGVLSSGRLLLKPVAGLPGDLICRDGLTVSINGRIAAIARDRSGNGRDLPRWSGCQRMATGEVLLISGHPSSFDGRYLGAIDIRQAIGVAQPVLTFPAAVTP